MNKEAIKKCKRSLYKSTYRGNAFTKGKIYNVIEEDDDFLYIEDNKSQRFNFSKIKNEPYYYIDDYFRQTQTTTTNQ